jgi:hypothetical protein
MTANEPDALGRRKGLEDEFFHREDQKLRDRLREAKAAAAARDSLATATGITNPAVLDRLMQLGIGADTVAALSIVPLVEVAWADGSLDAKEREAVLAAARQSGFAPDSVEHAMLATWLDRRPEPRLLTAWTELVQGMSEQLSQEETAKLRSHLLDRARAVARASGGVLGLGSKVSSAEAAMLSQLERAFGKTG